MQLGSPEHKAQVCQDLIKTYHENTWKDEIYLLTLEELRGGQRKNIAELSLKLNAVPDDKTKNGREARKAAEKAKFVAERELAHTEQEIKATEEKIQSWHGRIQLVKEYQAKDQA